jgi:hypothetical protein
MGLAAGRKARVRDFYEKSSVDTSSVTGITTTMTETDSLTFEAVAGSTYIIEWCVQVQSTAANDVLLCLLYLTSVTGTQIGGSRRELPQAGRNFPFFWVVEYEAPSTADVTIKGGVVRESGSGTVTRSGSSGAQATLRVRLKQDS